MIVKAAVSLKYSHSSFMHTFFKKCSAPMLFYLCSLFFVAVPHEILIAPYRCLRLQPKHQHFTSSEQPLPIFPVPQSPDKPFIVNIYQSAILILPSRWHELGGLLPNIRPPVQWSSHIGESTHWDNGLRAVPRGWGRGEQRSRGQASQFHSDINIAKYRRLSWSHLSQPGKQRVFS